MHQHLLSERRPVLARSQPVRLHVRLQARLHRQVLPADDRPVHLGSMQERRRLSLRTECPLLQMPSGIHWSLVTELLDFLHVFFYFYLNSCVCLAVRRRSITVRPVLVRTAACARRVRAVLAVSAQRAGRASAARRLWTTV